MSPPEVWGPSTWSLFHTLAEKIREDTYAFIYPTLFNLFTRICKYLPCPECANDATIFLAKINLSDLKTKLQFKNTFYLFHNYVNAKKRKRLFNYINMNIYNNNKLSFVINNFISNFQTKGNMKMINESFQRQFVINDFKNFIKKYIKVFIPIVPIPRRLQPSEIKSSNEIENTDIELESKNKIIETLEDFIYKPIDNLSLTENICLTEELSISKEIKNILYETIETIEN